MNFLYGNSILIKQTTNICLLRTAFVICSIEFCIHKPALRTFVRIFDALAYLGHEVTIAKNDESKRLQRSIVLDCATFSSLTDIFKNELPNRPKRNIFDQCIIPVMIYLIETLTVRRRDLQLKIS